MKNQLYLLMFLILFGFCSCKQGFNSSLFLFFSLRPSKPPPWFFYFLNIPFQHPKLPFNNICLVWFVHFCFFLQHTLLRHPFFEAQSAIILFVHDVVLFWLLVLLFFVEGDPFILLVFHIVHSKWSNGIASFCCSSLAL